MRVAISNNNRSTSSRIHPQKFGLYIACASIVMMFTGFTSAFIVRQAAGNWLEFNLPIQFFYSTAVIVLSSITLHAAYFYFKRGKKQLYRWLLLTTLILGVAFLLIQYQGWMFLNSVGIYLETNPSSSFIFVISAVHAAHIVGGITALIVANLHAFSLPFSVTPKRKLRFELTLFYWHFVDALWIYLLVFFVLQS